MSAAFIIPGPLGSSEHEPDSLLYRKGLFRPHVDFIGRGEVPGPLGTGEPWKRGTPGPSLKLEQVPLKNQRSSLVPSRQVTDRFKTTAEGRRYRVLVNNALMETEQELQDLERRVKNMADVQRGVLLNQRRNSLKAQLDQIDRQLRLVTPIKDWTPEEHKRTSDAVFEFFGNRGAGGPAASGVAVKGAGNNAARAAPKGGIPTANGSKPPAPAAGSLRQPQGAGKHQETGMDAKVTDPSPEILKPALKADATAQSTGKSPYQRQERDVPARDLAKDEVFAARTAPELKKIYGWGNGEAGVKGAREALDDAAMARIQGGVTRAEVEATRKLYQEAAAAGRGGAVAPERAAYMEDILKRWK